MKCIVLATNNVDITHAIFNRYNSCSNDREAQMNLFNPLQNFLHNTYRLVASNPWEKQVETDINENIHLIPKNVHTAGSSCTISETIQDIVDIVSTKGYVILPQVLSDDLLAKIRSEYQSILTTDVNTFRTVDRHDGAICVRMEPFFNNDNAARYPAASAFFNASLFHEITKRYYAGSKNGFDYISEIFVHQTPETKDPLSGKLHWDRVQTLKFWIYLDDIPLEAGPMRIEPDSVERNKAIRIQAHKEKSELIGGTENVVESPIQVPIALTAPAGSILIHDTDASHGATEVKAGYVRNIMRGHCRARS